MRITLPSSSDAPIQFEGLHLDPVEVMISQRERLSALLASLTPEQWATQSRCENWTVQEVITHLTTTNTFWNYSLTTGLSGDPSNLLVGFDPATTPAELVNAAPKLTTKETLAAFDTSNRELASTARTVGDKLWTAVAETPAGHLALGALMLHALWDSLIHECDIAIPLGLQTEVVPDEVEGSLAYGAGLSVGFAWMVDPRRSGALEILGTDPNIRLSVVLDGGVIVRSLAGDSTKTPEGFGRMEGRSTELLEALSVRAPLGDVVDAEHRWMVEGLANAFDQA